MLVTVQLECDKTIEDDMLVKIIHLTAKAFV